MCAPGADEYGGGSEDATTAAGVSPLAIVDAYYGGHARVRRDSVRVPPWAFFRHAPDLDDVNGPQNRRPHRRRRRHRPYDAPALSALTDAGKFVALGADVIALLEAAHRRCTHPPDRLARLLSDLDLPETSTPPPQPSLLPLLLSSSSPRVLSATDTHEAPTPARALHPGTMADVLLPPRVGFCLGDVRDILGPDRPAALAPGAFDLIVMDPPWGNHSVHRGRRYTTWDHRELLKLAIPAVTAPSACALGLWVTNRPAYEAFVRDELLPHWGFELFTCWFWLKIATDGALVSPLASTHRLPVEKLLVATRGDDPEAVKTLREGLARRPRVVVSVPLRHSWKPPPEAFFGPDEGDNAPDSMRRGHWRRPLEVFARELRPGWWSVGNEVLKFQAVELFDLAATTTA